LQIKYTEHLGLSISFPLVKKKKDRILFQLPKYLHLELKNKPRKSSTLPWSRTYITSKSLHT